MHLTILETDTAFKNSPDVGDPECLCSRCGEAITEDEVAIRAWEGVLEYRYHIECLGASAPEVQP